MIFFGWTLVNEDSLKDSGSTTNIKGIFMKQKCHPQVRFNHFVESPAGVHSSRSISPESVSLGQVLSVTGASWLKLRTVAHNEATEPVVNALVRADHSMTYVN